MSAIQQCVASVFRSYGPPQPDSISGLKLWYKPEGINQSGGVLTTWSDSSGNGYTGTPSTSNLEINSSVINGYSAVNFNYDGQINTTATFANLSTSNAYTMFVVCKSNTTGVNANGYITGSASRTQYYFQQYDTITMRCGWYDTGQSWYDVAYTNNAAIVLEQSKASGTGSAFQGRTGGTSFGPENQDNFYNYTDTFVIGGPYGGTQWRGEMCEVIIYNVELSSGNKTTVRNYINSKYGLTT